MNDQLESSFKTIVDAIASLQTAVTAMTSKDNANIEQRESQEKHCENEDVEPNVSVDMKKDRNMEEFVEHKDIEKQVKPNPFETEELTQSDAGNVQGETNWQKASETSLISSICLLNSSIRDLGEELRKLHTTIKDQAHQKRQCYVNWCEKHQVLYTGLYVARQELLDALWKIQKLAEYKIITKDEVNSLFSFNIHKVTKHGRFPDDGVYVNIKDYDIYFPMSRLRGMEYDMSNSLNRTVFVDSLCGIRELALSQLGDAKSAGVLFDMKMFETMYNLQWD